MKLQQTIQCNTCSFQLIETYTKLRFRHKIQHFYADRIL